MEDEGKIIKMYGWLEGQEAMRKFRYDEALDDIEKKYWYGKLMATRKIINYMKENFKEVV